MLTARNHAQMFIVVVDELDHVYTEKSCATFSPMTRGFAHCAQQRHCRWTSQNGFQLLDQGLLCGTWRNFF
jgi:hypothetical protein